MTRTIRGIRRPSIVAVPTAVMLALVGCGSDVRPTVEMSEPPVIEVAGGAGGGVSADAALNASGAAEMSKMAAPLVFEYAGDEVDLTSPMRAYRFVSGGAPSDEQLRRLADAFGVSGDISVLPDEQGGGRQVGPLDGSGPSLTVMADALRTWWFSDPSGAATAVTCVAESTTGAVAPESGTGAVAPESGAGAAPPECVEPEPPADVPTGPEGEAIARDLLTAAGLDLEGYELETYADEWAVSVTGFLTVDGVRSPISVSVGIGVAGKVMWAGGSLAEPETGAEYPRIGIPAAIERLNGQYGSWMSVDRVMADPIEGSVGVEGSGAGGSGAGEIGVSGSAAVDPAVVDPAVGAPVAVDPGVPVPPEPSIEPVTVRLTDPRPTLEQVWGIDDVVWLLPAYAFTGDDGGRYTVLAVDDAYIRTVTPAPEPLPEPVPGAVTPDVVTPDVAVPDVGAPSVGDAPEVVGLQLDEATKVAERAGWTLRAVRVNGEDLAATADYVTTRLNVAVDDGIVTEVLSVG